VFFTNWQNQVKVAYARLSPLNVEVNNLGLRRIRGSKRLLVLNMGREYKLIWL
jgi:hypothetical protein